MNERTYIVLYTLQSTSPSSAKYDAKHMFSYLDFRCYFEANGQNHIQFWLIQVLKNTMAWDYLTFRSLSSKLEFVYPQWSCGIEEQMLIFSSRLTPGGVKGSLNPIPKLAIVLIWKTPSCLKFGKTSNSAAQICHKENSEFEQRTMHALSQDFDATELWRARASSETIDLPTLEFGPNYFQSPYTTSERVTCISMSLQLRLRVPAS